MIDKESLSDKIMVMECKDGNLHQVCYVDFVRGFIDDELLLIWDLYNGYITWKDFNNKRDKLAGDTLSGTSELANHSPQTNQSVQKGRGDTLVHGSSCSDAPNKVKTEDKPLCECGHEESDHHKYYSKQFPQKCLLDCSCKKFKPLKSKLSKKEVSEIARKTLEETGYLKPLKGCGKDCDCDCHMFVGGSGKPCPACSLRPTRSGDKK